MMKIVSINNKKYYKLDDIISEYPNFNKGYKTTKNIFEKYELKNNDYTNTRLNDNEWVISDGKSKKFNKVFIRKKWFDDYSATKQDKEKIENNIEEAPPIIELNDNEKFYDDDGNIIEIEVRGERDVNKCYFKVYDVSKGFNLFELRNTILKHTSTYKINRHYLYFSIGSNVPNGRIKKLFLTYDGILKVLYSSRGDKTSMFTSWASKTLFTAQMGTKEQKNNLVSELLGIDTKTLNRVLKTTTTDVSCIYLINIGKVGKLRKKYDIDKTIDSNDYVAKYGRTCNLSRRLNEHKKNYGDQIELLIFEIIDPTLVSEAETSIANYFENLELKLETQSEDELIVFSQKKLKNIKRQYSLVGSKHRGNLSDHSNIVKDLTHKHEKEIMLKDKTVAEFKYELSLKDNEILKQKMELLELKNRQPNFDEILKKDKNIIEYINELYEITGNNNDYIKVNELKNFYNSHFKGKISYKIFCDKLIELGLTNTRKGKKRCRVWAGIKCRDNGI